MNLFAVTVAIARQPGIGSQRIVHLNGNDSLCDAVGAILIFAGVHPLELQYYQNVSTDKLWKTFAPYFIALDLTVDDVDYLFQLVDCKLPKTLDPKKRRDTVINILLNNQHVSTSRQSN